MYRALTEDVIRNEVAGLLGCEPRDVPHDDDLTECGMDSIRFMSLAGRLRRHGVFVDFLDLAERPTLAAWTALLATRPPHVPHTRRERQPAVAPALPHPSAEAPPQERAEPSGARSPDSGAPFPLTAMQHAYWIGRRDDQVLGGVGCHAYFEFDGARLAPRRLEHAVHAVIARHGMLRARFLDDGTQQIMPTSPWRGLTVHDLCAEQDPRPRLAAVREALSHRRLRVEHGEVFDVQLSLLPGGTSRIHLGIDLLVADVESIRILLADLARACLDDPGTEVGAPGIEARAPGAETASRTSPPGSESGFPRYLADREHDLDRTDARERARRYWRERLTDLPDGPALPLATDPSTLGAPRFTRRRYRVAPQAWERFRRRARQGGTTPAMALAAAYAQVLGAWSESSRFLLSLPMFDRDPAHADVDGMVADFTDLLLLPVDLSAGASFAERVHALQAEFRANVAHRACSGVEVLRDLARTDPDRPRRAPVVFACNLGTELVPPPVRTVLGELHWMISQTPQVWLDHQVYESDEGVDLCWDSVDDLFPPRLMDDMFDAYRTLVDGLSAEDSDWTTSASVPLPAPQRVVREKVNSTQRPLTPRTLHDSFFARARRQPDRPALLWGSGLGQSAMTYGELARRALGVAGALVEGGLRPGEPVAVSVRRGPDQIAAVLGVLAAGGAYVPIGADQPAERMRRILRRAGSRLMLSDAASRPGDAPGRLPADVAVLDVATTCARRPLAAPVSVDPGTPAYVIYTSGTTGEPKGVAVAHAAAANTVDDINTRLSLAGSDRVLAVSAMDFDLSVYDVFGLLSTGGALVLVAEAERRDPRAWADLIVRHRVTVWNSVPLLLDMLLTEATGRGTPLEGLRVALLSGDWIGLDLPGRLAGQSGGSCRFLALGGATEAAIWSNLYEVTEVPAGWASIPYGFPLANQEFRVVGPDGADRPDWVPGELWIGGAGVALGYLGDPGLTAERFPVRQGGRWYRTGDRGRYRPDGTLEFLGRIDQQVKIRGVRTEPGEIEAALGSHPAVGGCVVTTVGADRAKRLVAVATPRHATAPNLPAPGGSPGRAAGGGTDRGPGTGHWAVRGETDPEARAVESLLARLAVREAGITGTATSLPELARRWGAPAEWHPLLRLWFDWLTSREVLTGDRHGYAAGPRLTEVCRDAAGADRGEAVGDTGRSFAGGSGPGFGRGTGQDDAGRELARISARLNGRMDDIAAIVRGALDPLVLLDDSVLAPTALADAVPDRNTTALDALVREIQDAPAPSDIAVLGAVGARTLTRLTAPGQRHRLTLIDESTARLAAARDVAGRLPEDRIRMCRTSGGLLPDDLLAAFDVVVADNALHAFPDPTTGIGLAALLLAPGGRLLALERTELPPFALIAAALPTRGFTTLDAVRRDRRTTLLPVEEWSRLLTAHGLTCPATDDCPPGAEVLLRAHRTADAGLPSGPEMRDWLADRLPAAMLPDRVYGVPALPVTANGKLDRTALARLLPDPEDTGAAGEPPRGPSESVLASAWCAVLGVARVGRDDNFFGLGGDSLLATRLVGHLRKAGLPLDLSAVFATPVLKDLAPHLAPHVVGGQAVYGNVGPAQGAKPDAGSGPDASSPRQAEETPSRPPLTVSADPGHRHDPFPPTDVQRAYWTGRATGLPLGGVGAHYYTEFDGTGLDLERLERAWNQLVARHEMLRAVFDEDGGQRILAEVPRATIPVEHAAADRAAQALADLRAGMSHQVRDPARWPLNDLRAVVYEQDGEQRVRLGVSLENIVLDGRSMMIVLSELEQLYHAPDAVLPPVAGLSFRDYLIQVTPSEEETKAARRYWTERLADLPPAPALPLAAHPSAVGTPRFVRRSGLLPADRWRALTERAARHGLTPSVVLLTAYAEVLARWSGRPELTVNLTLFDRQDVHPAVDDIVGDFTSLLPLAYRPEAGTGFLARAQALQRRLGQDLDHRAWSAVRVSRELARAQGTAEAALPVVFTSALGTRRDLSLDLSDWLLPKVWGISQTPQTWLDNQVYDSPRGLHYDWDAVEQLLPDTVLDPMFDAYGHLLDRLGETDWSAPLSDLLPAGQRRVRERVNATDGPLPSLTLHEPFFERAAKEPHLTACVGDFGRLSYGELALRARRVAGKLRASGVREGDSVALHLPKGPDQLACVLGVLAAGAAYVPVGLDQPPLRRTELYRSAGVGCVLAATGAAAHAEAAPEGVTVLSVEDCSDSEPLVGLVGVGVDAVAYVIFTSGSTGVPKGVEVSHGAAMNTVVDVCRRFGVGVGDRVLAVSALDFDLSVFDVFGLLGVGGALVLVGEGERRDAECWVRLVAEHGVTVWNSVPMLLEMLVAAVGSAGVLASSLRLALVSGDWVGLDLKSRLVRVGSGCRLVALGGATEAGIWSNWWEVAEVPAHWVSVPYGLPLGNQRFRVVDGEGRDCPDLVAGELWIGGASLALGYRGEPELTARKFVVGADGGRWYRTGDVGRYWADGTLEFLGRRDHQLKVSGHRVELGEIESVLETHPSVHHAVVTVDDTGARRRLVAHVVSGHTLPEAELTAFLRDRLPGHAVPAAIGLLDELPLTANGKVDRAALAAAAPAAPVTDGGEAPRTPVERLVSDVWSEVLDVPRPPRDGNFFLLGGDSLLATKVVALLRAAGVNGAAISGLFTTPVLADFAAPLTLGPAPDAERLPTIAPDPANRHQPFAPTELQRAYWVGRSPGFTLGGVGSYYYCEFDESGFDLERLEAAWNRLIARHEMLRAVFDEDGDQRILPEVPRLRVPVTDAPDGAAEEALERLREEMSHQVLDPGTWPLFDVRAVRLGGGRARVGIGLDYLLVDGLSMMILFAELDTLYRDPAAELPPVDFSFRDYVCQAKPSRTESEAALDHWRRRVPELPPAPALPLAADPASIARPRFARRETWLDPARWSTLQDRAKQCGLTPSAVLLAAYAEVLSTWSADLELTVGLTLFDRRAAHPHIDRVLGDFTSLLPVAHQPLAGESFESRVRRLQERMWQDLDHRGAPVLGLLRESAGAAGGAEGALPVVFTSALGVNDTLSDGLRKPVWSVSQTPQVWLDEQVMMRDGGLQLTWDAVDELFPAGVLDAMFAAHGELLDWIVRADWSERTPALLPSRQSAVRDAVNATTGPLPDQLLHAAFFTRAAAEPDRPALLWDKDGRMTYGELADRALRVAAMLRAEGVRPGDLVAVTLPKGPAQIAAVLGVLAAGAAYVPVGVDQPAVRRERMLAAAGVRHTITTVHAADAFEPLVGLVGVGVDAVAYVIFTSGSTGVPKGVEVSHGAAMNTVVDVCRRFGVGVGDRVLAVSALDFDLSVFDVFGLLGVGGALVLVGEGERRDAECWVRLVAEHGVTVWNSVPMLLEMLVAAVGSAGVLASSLRLALVSGDWVGLDLKSRLVRVGSGCRLVALGGATEAGIWSNWWEVAEVPAHWVSVPYGLPLGNQRFRVVDGEGRDCPDLVAGELWIGGASLALGYRGEPELTARKFVVGADGGRWYRTGDVGRYWADGTLEFLGRRDHQLKVSGHRVELGEIESVLETHPAVHHAVVMPVGERDDRRLHAFVTIRPSALTPDFDLFVADRLPAHARPAGYTPLDELPLTANGKVDRAALVPLVPDGPATLPPGDAPRGPVETALAALWSSVLGLPEVPRDATFFALGGDSLRATRLVQRLRHEFGGDISLRQLLGEPTIAGLAKLIEPQHLAIEDEDTEDGTL
ncbi:amino acid adenylation domain-containing protein [Streptomyces sp. NBC_00820]|uniref:amino acid adenylation domain-containing protein n=1 Tax=Streptomyces sp. NBC_00820 TaxID=2975842 RepID=UPI002ED03D9D|nr:amino acid adenylation domain-containing protein [Streptomyces sp. NBC_00820]